MGKIYELIRPASIDDINYADYEYLIRWIGRDGSDYVYMFYDAEFRQRVRAELVNEDDQENIQSIIKSISRSVRLTASDLTKNDLLIVTQIFENKFVQRLKIDGTTVRYAPDSNSFKYRLKDGRYEINFKLNLSNIKTWK